MNMRSYVRAALLFVVSILLGLLSPGCQAEAHIVRESAHDLDVTYPDGTHFKYSRTINGSSNAKSPTPTSQPTIATMDDTESTAGASGQQLPPILPPYAYSEKTQTIIFYGGAALCFVGAGFAMWRAKPQLAGWLVAIGIALILAKVFIETYAVYTLPLLAFGGVCWYIAHRVEKKKRDELEARKVANLNTNVVAIGALREGASPAIAEKIIASGPSGADAVRIIDGK